MDRLNTKRCRESVGSSAEALSDEQILAMRDMIYELAGIVIDAYSELGTIDQSLFNPPGDVIDQLNAFAELTRQKQ
jgi:hypothetical protein